MQQSLKRLQDILVPGMTVYPGHGLPFVIKKLGDKSGQFAFLGWRGMHWCNKILVQDSSKDESLLLDLGEELWRGKQVL